MTAKPGRLAYCLRQTFGDDGTGGGSAINWESLTCGEYGLSKLFEVVVWPTVDELDVDNASYEVLLTTVKAICGAIADRINSEAALGGKVSFWYSKYSVLWCLTEHKLEKFQ